MKPFFPRFCLLGAPLILVAQGTLTFAAPVDRAGAVKDTSALPWLNGVVPADFARGDEFSRAVTALEGCRTAEAEASRRAARGEITPRELQTFRSATERAQRRVEELLLRDGKPRITTTFPSVHSAPPLRAPALVSLPPGQNINKVSSPAPRMAPRVTALDHTTEGAISSPVYGTRQMLHRPQKAGQRPSMNFIAMLPQNKGAVPNAVIPETASGTKTAVVIVPPPVPTRNSATIISPLATLPPTPSPAKTAAPNAAATPKPPDSAATAKSAAQSAADLQRLAKLDAELQRADKRLSAANDALSEGQQQLTNFANTLRQAMLEAGPDAVGLHPFVKIAEKYAGTPYVWGGESRDGFDCSGMIIRVMRDLGYQALPHSAAEQFRYGKPIAQELLKPGDLVFFANTYKAGISHVGIYLGKRRFIHAAGTGKGTIVSSLDDAKYQAKYAGGRRLIASRGN